MGTLIAVEMGTYVGTKPTRAGVSQVHRVNPEASRRSPRWQAHTGTGATAPVGVGWALGLAKHELVQRTLNLWPEDLGSCIDYAPHCVPKPLDTSQAVNVKQGCVLVYFPRGSQANVRVTGGSPLWPGLMVLSGGGHYRRLSCFWNADLLPARSSFEICRSASFKSFVPHF